MRNNYLTVEEFMIERESKGHYLLGENFVWEALSDKGLVKVENGNKTIASDNKHIAMEGENGELLFAKHVIESAYEDYLEEIEMEMERLEWELDQL